MYKKKNIVRPFEDVSSLEFFSKKSDAALVAFGSHNKKRPHNMVLARMFDFQVLDMVEFGISNYIPLRYEQCLTVMKWTLIGLNTSINGYFGSKLNTIPSETKPMLAFAGDQWDTTTELKDGATVEWRRVRSLLVDFFRGEDISAIRRKGLEYFIQFTLLNGIIDTNWIDLKLL